MIITITGKPCSGKGTVSKLFCEKYNFEYVCTGDMFRKLALDNGHDNILEFQKHNDVEKFDHIIDDQTAELGKTRLDDNIVIDSRLAWHFVPKSFKVFIDIDWQTAGERLLLSNRETERVTTLEDASALLQERWQIENRRYSKIYKTDNLNLKNYDFVISSSGKTPLEICELIYEQYQKFMQNA